MRTAMPALRIDVERRVIEVDLHGYALRDARRVARDKVREAWQNGFLRITLIHGAGGVRRPTDAFSTGYGIIKWHLRGQFERGKWRQYLYHGGSPKHRLDEGCMRLAVRPNPQPCDPPQWSPLPQAEYGQE